MDAMKVPNIANVTIAPKFEKKGFCHEQTREVSQSFKENKLQAQNNHFRKGLTGERLKPD